MLIGPYIGVCVMIRVLQCVTGNFSIAGLSRIVFNWGQCIKHEGICFDYLSRKKDNDNQIKDLIIESGGKVFEPSERASYAVLEKKIILENNYAVVHIHSDTSFNLLRSAIVAKKNGVKKIILHSHSSGLDKPNDKKMFFKYMIKLCAHNVCKPFLPYFATEFCSCSNEATKWMYPKKIISGVKLISNSIDMTRFSFDKVNREIYRNKYGLSKSYVVGHVGRYVYQKNHDFILQISKLIPEDSKILFVLIGDGDEYVRIKNNISKEGINNVIMLGRRSDVAEWMQAFDLFILPSHFEGLPVVGVEAQSSGLGCLFSNNIDRYSRILDETEFIDLDAQTWAERIIYYSQNNNSLEERIRRSQHALQSEFNIRIGIKKLVELYRE